MVNLIAKKSQGCYKVNNEIIYIETYFNELCHVKILPPLKCLRASDNNALLVVSSQLFFFQTIEILLNLL